MTPPSKLAVSIVLALDSTLANCYRNPEAYAKTTEGNPSSWPDEVRAEVHSRALVVDCVLNSSGAIQTWSVHARIVDELTGELVVEGDFRYQCAEHELLSVVDDDLTAQESCKGLRAVVVHVDYYNSVFEL